jgi:hypothetical protein
MPSLMMLLLLGFSVIGAGCATALTEEGAKVELFDKVPSNLEDDYSHMGIITCQKEQNLASVEKNRKSCLNELRNQAAQKGADAVVLDADETFPGTATVGVFMIGHTYRRR